MNEEIYNFNHTNEQYESYYIYRGMIIKIKDSLAQENISQRSFDQKERLNTMLNLDFTLGKGYTYSTEIAMVRNKKLYYRHVSNSIDFNKIQLQYISWLTCGGYLEATSPENLPFNIICNCEINIHFVCRRALERVHAKIQYELSTFEEMEERTL